MKLPHLVFGIALFAVAAPVGAARTSRTTRRIAQRTATTASAARPATTATTPAPVARPVTPPVAPVARPVTTPPVTVQPVATTPPANGALTVEQMVANVQNFYNRTTDFEADFAQVHRNGLTGQEQSTVGHVRLAKPGKMRWEYTSPAGDLLVSDGTTVWGYQAAARTAYQSNLRQEQLPSAVSFLLGTGNLTTDFTARLIATRPASFATGYVIELTPKTADPRVAKIVLYVDAASWQVIRTAVFDASNNRNIITFTNPRVNLRPAATVFQWTPPAGTQITHT